MDRVGFCLIFGTFDVDNYGDLLFPVVAGWRLSQRIIACSPTRNIPTFVRDSQEEHLSFEDLSGVYPLAILIGGGNILHFRRSGVKPYKWRWFSYAGLQLIPFLLKKRFGVPVLYNSPSIALKKDCFIWRKLFTYLFSRADYLSFRDAESVYFARQIVTKQVFCVPDTAFDVGRIWPRQDSVRPVKEDYAIVHVNKRYGGSCQQIASSLDQVQERLGLTIVFFL